MSTTIAINALLADMPAGQVFTTRDLMGIGSRSSIDKCLKRLVDNCSIVRVARGVFSNGSEKPNITPFELAQIKARAFHKEIYEHATTIAQRLGYIPKPQTTTGVPLTFATSGTGSTSFQSIFGRIHLKAASARKRNEFSDEVWELVKALWCLGKNGSSSRIDNRIAQLWGRNSQEKLQRFAASIPQWLLERFPPNYETAFRSIYLNLIPHAGDEIANRFHESEECKAMVQAMPPGFATFDPSLEYSPPFVSPITEDSPSPSECWCPESDECICDLFTCAYCISQPIRNRFSIALG